MRSSRQSSKRPRPPVVAASDELRSLMAAIETEISSWPDVRINSMFGMRSVYRGKNIFALLPKTRSLKTGDAIWMKFGKLTPRIRKTISEQPRILLPSKPTGAQWYTLSEVTVGDYGVAIDWLARAHESAR
jgi:hypothetical protein